MPRKTEDVDFYGYKKRCPLCKKYFVVTNEGKVYCLACKPKQRYKNADNQDN